MLLNNELQLIMKHVLQISLLLQIEMFIFIGEFICIDSLQVKALSPNILWKSQDT